MASVARYVRRTRLAIAGAVVLMVLTAATASASMPSAEGATAQGPASVAPSSATRPDRGGRPSTRPGPGAKSQFPGFLLRKGRFTRIDAPGAAATFAFDINDAGQIAGVGFSGTDATAVGRGFVLRRSVKGPFTPVAVPGALSTSAAGINDHGDVAGGYTPPSAGSKPQATSMQPLG
jgi:uncharacterized membrane protein